MPKYEILEPRIFRMFTHMPQSTIKIKKVNDPLVQGGVKNNKFLYLVFCHNALFGVVSESVTAYKQPWKLKPQFLGFSGF